MTGQAVNAPAAPAGYEQVDVTKIWLAPHIVGYRTVQDAADRAGGDGAGDPVVHLLLHDPAKNVWSAAITVIEHGDPVRTYFWDAENVTTSHPDRACWYESLQVLYRAAVQALAHETDLDFARTVYARRCAAALDMLVASHPAWVEAEAALLALAFPHIAGRVAEERVPPPGSSASS